jgi:hypothetical protein
MCRAKRWSHAGRRWAGPHPHGRVQSSTRRHKSLYSTPMSMHRYHPCRCWWRCRSSHRHKRRQPHQWWCRRCCRRRRCSPRSTRCTTPLRDNTAASGEARGSRHAGGYKFALYLQVTRGTGAVAGVCQGREGGGCAPRTWTIGILEHLTAARGQHVHLRPVARPCRRRHRKHTGGRVAAANTACVFRGGRVAAGGRAGHEALLTGARRGAVRNISSRVSSNIALTFVPVAGDAFAARRAGSADRGGG